MDENEIKASIFERLCRERRTRGDDAVMDFDTLCRDLNLPEEAGKVVDGLLKAGGVYINGSVHGKTIYLGPGGKVACDQGRNPFR